MKKISAFEYAIMQAADPEEAKKYSPYTHEEQQKMREEKLKETAKQIRIKKS